MLKYSDINRLNRCLPVDHILLELENWIVTERAEQLRTRLNSGEKLNTEEFLELPYSTTLGKIKIKDQEDIQWLTAFSISTGRDLQSMFETENYIYLTLFIDNKYIHNQMKELLKKYNFLEVFKVNPYANITVSFPKTLKKRIKK